jgi:hypothetical protein
MNAQSIDNLVLGTVNAPWKRSLSATMLAEKVRLGEVDGWLPHIATFFTEVSPRLILDFVKVHRISPTALRDCYEKVRALTGEANRQLENAFAGLGKAA